MSELKTAFKIFLFIYIATFVIGISYALYRGLAFSDLSELVGFWIGLIVTFVPIAMLCYFGGLTIAMHKGKSLFGVVALAASGFLIYMYYMLVYVIAFDEVKKALNPFNGNYIPKAVAESADTKEVEYKLEINGYRAYLTIKGKHAVSELSFNVCLEGDNITLSQGRPDTTDYCQITKAESELEFILKGKRNDELECHSCEQGPYASIWQVTYQ
ncbi:hypothetical protein [Zooshikella ganghwensis]|uniref:Uncharacterized protein n=1 Tax=Zooshikella ganghwensis TaxID=202772 RepID=A0A4P9VJ81_9GAMM|nr:hypothetical protein [Zooshikella ganghwensis]RDH42277.1 hypothetical protein B9G39_01800 [Zooshikella ganghwensis]